MRRFLLLVALASAAAGCGRDPAAPRVQVVDLAGLKQALAPSGARTTVVNFWATWCAPCVEELPDLIAAVQARGGGAPDLVLVSYDLRTPGVKFTAETVVPMVQEFLAKRRLDAHVLVYDDRVAALDELFDLPGPLPATIVLDRDGNVIHRHAGKATRAEFDALVELAVQAATEPAHAVPPEK